MARKSIIGFETGTLAHEVTSVGSGVIESTNINTGGGAYSTKWTTGSAASAMQLNAGLALGTVYTKIWFMVDSTATPSAFTNYLINAFYDSAGSRLAEFYVAQTNAGGAFTIELINAAGSTVSSTSITIVANTWYCFECAFTKGAGTGSITIYKDGVSTVSASSQQFGANNVDRVYTGLQGSGGAQSRSYYYDDFECDDAALPGLGYVIARQLKAGAPTDNAFTKSNGSTIDTVWNDTPFSTATSANSGSTKNSVSQTGLTASFSSTQTGHGTGTIAAADTIGGIKVGFVAKISSAASHNIRRIFNAVATNTSVALTTSDTYKETAPFTDTLTNLNASEIGANKAATGSVATMTVEDVWCFASYVPAPTSAQIPSGPLHASKLAQISKFGRRLAA